MYTGRCAGAPGYGFRCIGAHTENAAYYLEAELKPEKLIFMQAGCYLPAHDLRLRIVPSNLYCLFPGLLLSQGCTLCTQDGCRIGLR